MFIVLHLLSSTGPGSTSLLPSDVTHPTSPQVTNHTVSDVRSAASNITDMLLNLFEHCAFLICHKCHVPCFWNLIYIGVAGLLIIYNISIPPVGPTTMLSLLTFFFSFLQPCFIVPATSDWLNRGYPVGCVPAHFPWAATVLPPLTLHICLCSLECIQKALSVLHIL